MPVQEVLPLQLELHQRGRAQRWGGPAGLALGLQQQKMLAHFPLLPQGEEAAALEGGVR